MKIKKKFQTVVILLVVLLLIPFIPARAAAPTAAVTGEICSAALGQEIDFRVSLTGNPGLTSLKISLQFDTGVFSLVSDENGIACRQGDFTNQGILVCGPETDGCSVFWSHTRNVTTDGTLFSIRLRLADTAAVGTYPIKISCDPRSTINAAEETVALPCTDGAISVRTYQPLILGEELTAAPCEEFAFRVSIIDNPGIAAVNVQLFFDPDVLTLLDVDDSYLTEPDNAFGAGVYQSVPYANAVNVLWTNIYNVSATGELFSVRFRVKDTAKFADSPIRVICISENTRNESGAKVEFQCKNGSVTVLPEIHIAFPDSHHALITIEHVTSGHVIAALYTKDGKLLNAVPQVVSELKTVIQAENSIVDFSRADCKITFLDDQMCPNMPCYTFVGGIGSFEK